MGNISMILPWELVDIILSFLKNTDRMMLRQVCQIYRDYIKRYPINLVDIVQDGSLNILRDFYALISDSKFLSRICQYASRFDRLEILKWARDHGCAWDTNTCSNVALGGHQKR